MRVLQVLQSLLLLAIAFVGITHGSSAPHERCFTTYGSKSVKHIPTKTATVEAPHETVITYVTPTKTVKPPPKTVTTTKVDTDTVTVTVRSTNTFTITHTSTASLRVTEPPATITEITTTVTTTTRVQHTVTVPAPSRFTPILDTLPNSDEYNSQSSNVRIKKLVRALAQKQSRYTGGDKARRYAEQGKEPQSVLCQVTSTNEPCKTVTSTHAAKTVTEHANTVTKTVTSIMTATSTKLLHPASTTRAVTTTTTITTSIKPISTVTVTPTTTSTTMEPAATVYAICENARNYANGISNGAIVDFSREDGMQLYQNFAPASSAEDCCTQCIGLPVCLYNAGSENPEYICQQYTYETSGHTCDANSPAYYQATYDTSTPEYYGGVLFNGICNIFNEEAPAANT